MRFSLLEKDPVSISKWNKYVKENKDCGIYHGFQFLRFISNYFNLEIYLFCVEKKGEIVGILPMHRTKAFPYGTQLVSNAFNGSYGGMCTNNDEISKYLVQNLINYVSYMSVRYSEIRDGDKNNYNLPVYDIFVNYNLSLSGTIDESWMRKISSKTRNQIRRGLRKCEIKLIEKEVVKKEGFASYNAAFLSYNTHLKPKTEIEFQEEIASLDVNWEFWGIYNVGKMIGYCQNKVIDSCCDYSTIKFHPDYLKFYSSYALFYTMNNYYLNEKRFKYVNDGARSISHETNIQEFLMQKFKFRKAYCKLNIIYSKPINSFKNI